MVGTTTGVAPPFGLLLAPPLAAAPDDGTWSSTTVYLYRRILTVPAFNSLDPKYTHNGQYNFSHASHCLTNLGFAFCINFTRKPASHNVAVNFIRSCNVSAPSSSEA